MDTNYKLLPLYPQSNVIYDNEAELMLQSFADPKVRNIGIIAPYGAGKSSLIETFKQKYNKSQSISPKLRFLDLTLASFNSDSQTESNKNSNTNSEDGEFNNSVEKSILQQMLYKKEKNDLPSSNIKRANNFVLSKFLMYLAMTILTVIFISTTILFSVNANGTSVFAFANWNIVYPVVAMIALALLAILIARTISISKIAIKDIEINLNDKSESLLNKFLDEVIYFFQKTRYNVVILEDLDRFDNLTIFTKLRELNIVLNQNLKVHKKCGPIRFIYAVRSDIFQSSEERAKFFDIIFTVFPVLSPINTRDMIENALNQSGLGANWVSKSFINDISFFIKDVRVLNSIINDCVIFVRNSGYESINIEPRQKNIQLFAFMAYKDTQPKEFAELQKEQGELYDLRNKAQDKVEQLRSALQVKLSSNQERLVRLIAQSSSSEIIKLRQEEDDLHKQMNQLPEPIAYLQDHFDEIANQQKTTEILKMLICNGYFTDRFNNFLSIHTEKSFLSQNDELFIRRVLMREQPDFNAPIDNVSFVVEDLSVDKFTRNSILNYDVVDYLFGSKEKSSDRLTAVKQLLKKEDGEVMMFLRHYIEREDAIANEVIAFMVEERNDILSMILSPETSNNVQTRLSRQILIRATKEQISKQQKLYEFISFLNKNAVTLDCLKLIEQKLPFLEQKGLKIPNLEECNFTPEVLRLIEKYKLWEINHSNTVYLLTTLYNVTEENIKIKGYSLIVSLSNKETSSYILRDLSRYVHDIMLKAENLDLEENDFKQLVVNNKLDIKDIESIIDKQITPVAYWSACPQNILKLLLHTNKVVLTAAQIQNLAQTTDLSDDLAAYLAGNYEKYVGELQHNSALTLLIANSDLTIDGKSLLEVYYEESMKQYLSPLTRIHDDLTLAFIISNVRPKLQQAEIEYVIRFPIAAEVLGKYCLKAIIENHWLTNDIAHLGIRFNQNKDIRTQLYLFDNWDLSHDDYSFIGAMLNNICDNQYKISMQLYEQLVAFPTIDKAKLLKSQLQYMQKDELCIKLKSIPRYRDLFKNGKIECSSFEREDADIIYFLYQHGIVRKRRGKGKIFLYLQAKEDPSPTDNK